MSRGSRARASLAGGAPGDWPSTTRILPWLVAGFLAMIWLVPFDAVTLPVQLPLDAKLDRLFLVVIAAAWGAALFSADASLRPHVRLGAVHLAALVFLLVAAAGTLFNSTALANLGELSLALKKLVLLACFLFLFLFVGSAVRPGEVHRFATLVVGLSCVAALGTIVEYRFHYNVFYDLVDRLPLLDVTRPVDLDQRDSIGRLSVYGPAGSPIENATMLALALPFAVIGIVEGATRRIRIAYVVGAAVLLAGAMSTARKTSVIASAAGLVVLLAYRPRTLITRALPLGAAFFVLIHVLAPQALGSLVQQLHPQALNGVLSTRDRASDYAGVAPDITAHPLFGRGYKSFDPLSYRILDNEYLGLVVGVGLVGLAAYLVLLACSLREAHALARRGPPELVPTAIAGAGTVAVVIVSTGLFDLLSFPHVPYLFLFLVGLLVSAGSAEATGPEPTWMPAGGAGTSVRLRPLRA